MKSSLGLWALTLTLLITAGITAQEIIVEANGPPSQSGVFRVHSGDWSRSTGESSASGLTPDNGSMFCNGGRDGTASFIPEITQSGDYEIFVTWCTSGNSTDVIYTINHEDGQSQVTLTQDGWGGHGASNANQWVSLGTFPLGAGETGGVAVTSQASATPPTPRSMHRVYADAVQFVRRGGSSASASRGSSASATTTPVASRGPAPQVSDRDLIIEVNIPSPAGTFRTLDGNWNTSVGKSLAAGLTHDEGTLFMPLGRPGSAIFQFNIPASGTYDVYTTWCTSGNSTDALYTIQHADGRSQVTLTQDGWGGRGSSNANEWVRLGTHRFEAGRPASVTVTSQEGSTTPDDRNAHRVYADGMRLVPRDAGGTMIASGGSSASTSSRYTPPTPAPVVASRPEPRSAPAGESSLISWRYSHDIAEAESRSDGKPLVIYAYTERSRTCRENEATLLRDPGVIANLSDTVPLRINLSENTDLAPVLRVYRVPTFIVVDANGREVGRHLGPITSQELIDLINGY
ncbi:hypothetical protein JXA47_00250 [Candidatus Sumerlaeota bacterium]|nr:hypothetical protein [Candidatus Sumerlaeota bacterium]